ncbi:DnaC replication protein [Sporolactobacillus sp. THM7-7]|nr:DnaC replication protein [Sporolactobacillus sp. THM7-7]
MLKEFECPGCGEKVQQTEFVIPFGPHKGDKFIKNVGCRCEDIKLADQAIKTRQHVIWERSKEMFDANSLINRSLQKATFENYQPPTPELKLAKIKIYQFAQKFDPQESKNLLLKGSYGTGKSHLSVAALKVLLNRGYTCLFLSVPKLLTKIKATYSHDTRWNEDDLMDIIQRVDLLVLDDVGTEYTNLRNDQDNWTQSKLFELMDSRSGRHTIYTTNLGSAELEKKINSRNFSRMMEDTEIIIMDGPDYRKKQF